MSALKSQVGMRSGPYRDEVTPNRILAFCQALGIPEGHTAPPTFLTLFRRGEFDLFQKLGIDLARILHAEQEYRYENSIQAGDGIRFETTIANVLEKQGSSYHMQFIIFETEVHAERNSQTLRVGKTKTTVVVR